MPVDRPTDLLDEFAAISAAAPRPPSPARRTVMRSGLPLSTLAAAVVIVAAIAIGGFLAGRPAPLDEAAASSSPAPTSVASAPIVAATPEPSTATCAPLARIDRWEGAAGQRIATIELTNAGSSECRIERAPRVQLVDGGGNVLIDSGSTASDPSVTLAPGAHATTMVSVGNWCGPNPKAPISLAIWVSNGTRIVAEALDPTPLSVPPCNGPSLPPTITVRPWGA